MAEINMDAARKARSEVKREEHWVRLRGKRYKLPPELPMEFGICLAEGRIKDGLRAVFNGRFEAFYGDDFTNDDWAKFVTEIADLYAGKTVPNLLASDSSS